jgi:hypothetical protein
VPNGAVNHAASPPVPSLELQVARPWLATPSSPGGGSELFLGAHHVTTRGECHATLLWRLACSYVRCWNNDGETHGGQEFADRPSGLAPATDAARPKAKQAHHRCTYLDRLRAVERWEESRTGMPAPVFPPGATIVFGRNPSKFVFYFKNTNFRVHT